jgi:hypothetical protein
MLMPLMWLPPSALGAVRLTKYARFILCNVNISADSQHVTLENITQTGSRGEETLLFHPYIQELRRTSPRSIQHLRARLDDGDSGSPVTVNKDGGAEWIGWCTQQLREAGLRDVSPTPAAEEIPPPLPAVAAQPNTTVQQELVSPIHNSNVHCTELPDGYPICDSIGNAWEESLAEVTPACSQWKTPPPSPWRDPRSLSLFSFSPSGSLGLASAAMTAPTDPGAPLMMRGTSLREMSRNNSACSNYSWSFSAPPVSPPLSLEEL